jgi:hypothetical protein
LSDQPNFKASDKNGDKGFFKRFALWLNVNVDYY